MNLFLGYYIPYRHKIPLWEMETDYYLHNLDVEIGKEMKGYQKSFGVLEWSNDFDTSSNGTGAEKHLRQSRLHAKNKNKHLGDMIPDQSRRIQNVRERCRTQNTALSMWWKVALQINVQQRMWMQLGNSPSESMLPPRFERLYQPEKMAQFDRFFARSWATPVRRSHSAQHSGETDEQVSDFRRNIYGRPMDQVAKYNLNSDGEKQQDFLTLHQIILSHGFEAQKRPALRRFAQQHDVLDDGVKSFRPVMLNDGCPTSRYVGDTNWRNERVRDEYVRCVSSSDNLQTRVCNPISFGEFKESLNAMSLNVNDVRGIYNLAESGHLGRQIKSGCYKGLERDFSAVEVSTVVFEQINAYENIRSRGELQEGIPLMDSELKRRGFYTDGVKDTIAYEWERHLEAEKQYQETCSDGSLKFIRSDLTTTNSLKLYTSFFSPDQAMTTTDLTVLLGDNLENAERNNKSDHADVFKLKRKPRFVARASQKGISITSHEELSRTSSRPLFQFERRRPVPAGFEMINEDLFSRKENKFMVFNGPGVGSWTGATPVTKISGIEKMLSGSLQ